jgi:hypothetical protein
MLYNETIDSSERIVDGKIMITLIIARAYMKNRGFAGRENIANFKINDFCFVEGILGFSKPSVSVGFKKSRKNVSHYNFKLL